MTSDIDRDAASSTIKSDPLREFRRQIAVLIGLGFFSVSMVSLSQPQANTLVIGLAWGTLFGQLIASGFLLATRRESLAARLGSTLVWIVGLSVCFYCSAKFSSPRSADTEIFALVMLAIGIATSLFTALTLIAVSRLFGVRVTRPAQDESNSAHLHQFSLRQLLVLTTFIGIALGVGRILVHWLFMTEQWSRHVQGILITSLIALATILAQIPNWFALLLPQRWGVALVLTLLLTVAITAAEPTLLKSIGVTGPRHRLEWVLASISSFSTLWIIAFAYLFRRNGYRAVRR